MIFIFTDPGAHGAISAVDENEQILFSVPLVDGLPPDDFDIGFFEADKSSISFTSLFGKWFYFEDCHFGIEIADYKNVEVGKWRARNKADGTAGKPTIITADKIYHSGIITGEVKNWFRERGVCDMIKVEPREWQTIFKGFAGKDSKEKAFKCLRERYCQCKGRAKLLSTCGKTCSYFAFTDPSKCPLKKHGIIGPRGGYIDGNGDSVCGALHLKNYISTRSKLRS